MSYELIIAAFKNEISKVASLLENPEIDVNYRHQTKSDNPDKIVTPLMVAAAKGHIKIVEMLLADSRVDPRAVSGIGRSALSVAADYGQVEACKLLLPYSNLTAKDNYRLTAYTKAYVTYNSNAKDEALRKKTQAVLDLLRVPTFVKACEENNLAIAKEMVEEEHVDINAFYNDQSALQVACETVADEVIPYLLSLPGIDLNLQNSRGWTALHYACLPINHTILEIPSCEKGDEQSQRIAVVDELIKAGANVNIQTYQLNETPLYIAIAYNQLDLVKYLILAGADLNVKTSLSQTQNNYYDANTVLSSATLLIPTEKREMISESLLQKYFPNTAPELYDTLSYSVILAIAGITKMKDPRIQQEIENDLPPDLVEFIKARGKMYHFLKDFMDGRFKFKTFEILGDTVVINKQHGHFQQFNIRTAAPIAQPMETDLTLDSLVI